MVPESGCAAKFFDLHLNRIRLKCKWTNAWKELARRVALAWIKIENEIAVFSCFRKMIYIIYLHTFKPKRYTIRNEYVFRAQTNFSSCNAASVWVYLWNSHQIYIPNSFILNPFAVRTLMWHSLGYIKILERCKREINKPLSWKWSEPKSKEHHELNFDFCFL